MSESTPNTGKINVISALVTINTILLGVVAYLLMQERDRSHETQRDMTARLQAISEQYSKSDARLAVVEANHQMLMSLILSDRKKDREEARRGE